LHYIDQQAYNTWLPIPLPDFSSFTLKTKKITCHWWRIESCNYIYDS